VKETANPMISSVFYVVFSSVAQNSNLVFAQLNFFECEGQLCLSYTAFLIFEILMNLELVTKTNRPDVYTSQTTYTEASY